MKDYVVHQPILIAEALSDSTLKYDTTDKFILYLKISSLQYYLLVKPEKHIVSFYEKDLNNESSAKVFNEADEIILLPKLNTQISLRDIYDLISN